MSKISRHLLLLAPAIALLAGCSSARERDCPAVSTIVDTSIGTVFKPGAAADPSNELYTVEITGVQSSCDVDKSAVSSDTSLNVSFRATRAPNGGQARYKIPYFVAISQGDRILAKKEFAVDFGFEPGQTAVTFTDSVDSTTVTAGKDKKTFDYAILVGIQLTKAQLQYNRASSRLVP